MIDGINEKAFLKARNSVLRLLKFRLRSEGELREKLSTKNFSPSIINATVRYFKDIQLIDDRMFAKQWTASRLKKPFGLNRIRMELNQKGIDPAIIQETLHDAQDEYEELTTVAELARHRALKYKNIEPEKVRQRVYGYLTRRGFNTNIIIKVIQDL